MTPQVDDIPGVTDDPILRLIFTGKARHPGEAEEMYRDGSLPPTTTPAIEPLILNRLRTVTPASPLQLTLVEAVRRQYRISAQADKNVIIKARDR